MKNYASPFVDLPTKTRKRSLNYPIFYSNHYNLYICFKVYKASRNDHTNNRRCKLCARHIRSEKPEKVQRYSNLSGTGMKYSFFQEEFIFN